MVDGVEKREKRRKGNKKMSLINIERRPPNFCIALEKKKLRKHVTREATFGEEDQNEGLREKETT